MIFLCEYCDIRCLSYDGWMEHLLGSRHQAVVNREMDTWPRKLNERSLVVSVSSGTDPSGEDICWYFAGFGFVCDAYISPKSGFYVIQLDKPEFAQHALTGDHKTKTGKLSLQLKAVVSAEDWMKLMARYRQKEIEETPAVPVLSFEKRHSNLIQKLKDIPLEPQLQLFRQEFSMQPEEVIVMKSLIQDATEILRKKFPSCELHSYGMFISGLRSNASVFHISFDAVGSSSASTATGLLEDALSTTESIMELFIECIENKNRVDFFCCDLVSDATSLSPSVQFTHKASGIKCKFTFDSLLSVHASKMLNFLIELDSRLLDLFLLVRYWGQYHKLTGPKRISNYSLNLLLVVFLVRQKIIPSVTDLQTMSIYNKKINGWNIAYCTDKKKIVSLMSSNTKAPQFQVNPATGKPSAISILNLAKDFFEMYASLDFEINLICPRIGNVCKKSAFAPGKEDELPSGLHSYKLWSLVQTVKDSGTYKNQLNISTPLCVQDIFNLGENVSEKTSASVLKDFQSMCAETVDSIQKVLVSWDPKIMNIFEVDISIVSSVVAPPTEVLVPKPTMQPETAVTSTTENSEASNSSSPVSIWQSPPNNYNVNHHNFGNQNYTTVPQSSPASNSPVNYNPVPETTYPTNWIPSIMKNSPLLYGSPECILRFDESTPKKCNPSIPSFMKEKNLDFMSGETTLRLSPNIEFVKLFMTNLGSLMSHTETIARLKALWCSFLSDFFCDVWGKSFTFNVLPVHPSTYSHTTRQIATYQLDDPWVSGNMWEYACTASFKNPYRRQFEEIIGSTSSPTELAFVCHFEKPPFPFRNASQQFKGYKCGFLIKIKFDVSAKITEIANAKMRGVFIASLGKPFQKTESQTLTNLLFPILQYMVPKYQMFRLHRWLVSAPT